MVESRFLLLQFELQLTAKQACVTSTTEPKIGSWTMEQHNVIAPTTAGDGPTSVRQATCWNSN